MLIRNELELRFEMRWSSRLRKFGINEHLEKK